MSRVSTTPPWTNRTNAAGEAFNSVAVESMTLRGYAELVATEYGHELDLELLPWDEFVSRVGEKTALVTADHIDRSPHTSAAKAERVLGFRPSLLRLGCGTRSDRLADPRRATAPTVLVPVRPRLHRHKIEACAELEPEIRPEPAACFEIVPRSARFRAEVDRGRETSSAAPISGAEVDSGRETLARSRSARVRKSTPVEKRTPTATVITAEGAPLNPSCQN